MTTPMTSSRTASARCAGRSTLRAGEFYGSSLLRPSESKGWELDRVSVMNDGKEWAQPGDVSGWDGDRDRPTLYPSLWLRDRNGWHGDIRNGNLGAA